MEKSYEERFIEEYIGCDKEIETYKKRIENYNQIMNTLKQEEIKNFIDEFLKTESKVLLSYLKIDGVEIDRHTKNLIEKLSTERIYDSLNNKIHDKNYSIYSTEKHKKLLLQIKESRLLKNYYDLEDVESKIGFFNCKNCSYRIFRGLIHGYEKTDYLAKLKDIMNEEFYTKCLMNDIIFIEQFTRDPLGVSFGFDTNDLYEIIPESVRINNLEGITGINVNGHYLSSEEMKNIGKYIEKGHNEIYLQLKDMPNKINRSIVYLANVKKEEK